MQTCKKCFREIGEYPFCPYCGASQGSNLLTLEQIYSEWSTLYFRKVGRKSREGYENAWRTLRFLEQYAMSDIKISDYQLAMDTLQNKSRSLQNKLLLLIGQLCKYAVTVHRLDVINPSPYLILDGVQPKSREIFSDEEISRLFLYAQANERFSCTAREVLILIFTGLRPEELFGVEKNDVSLQYHFLFTWGSKTDAGKERIIPLIPQIMPYVFSFYFARGQENYLITSPRGYRVRIDNWRNRQFYPLMKELGINCADTPRRMVPYCCRHTYASLADRAGVDKDTIIKIVGHTSYKFTKRIYIHEKLPQLQAETNKIDRLVKQEITNNKEREGDVNGCRSGKTGNRRERPGIELSWRI